MRRIKKFSAVLFAAAMLSVMAAAPAGLLTAEAHSGRTDAYGGHHDYRNVSGLGYYHYHCGGYPPHLHPGGVCPYSNPAPDPAPARRPSKPEFKLKIARKKLDIMEGRKSKIALNIKASKASWKSSNPKVAAVSKSGKITAKKAGKAVIYAKYKGQTVKCKIKVKAAPVIRVSVMKWDEMKGIITLRIKNVSKKKITVYSELKSYGMGDYLGTLYTTGRTDTEILPGSTANIQFCDVSLNLGYDSSFDPEGEGSDMVYYGERIIFRFRLGREEKKCTLWHNSDYDEAKIKVQQAWN